MSTTTNVATAAERWVIEIERHILSQQQIMIDAAAKCAPYKKLISEAKAAAKSEGISVKALSALILERKHLRNAAKVREKLEEDIVDELEMLRDQVKPVEGLELFAFAAERLDEEIAEAKSKRQSKRAKDKSDAIDSLTDDFESGDDRPPHLRAAHEQIEAEQRAAAENAAKLAGGIQPLA